jgi:hypothetical protein
MDGITPAFEDRLQEIETYLDLLNTLEQQVQVGPPRVGGTTRGGGTIITAQQQKILYSSVYLQLYNLIEATAAWCVQAVCLAATEGGPWLPTDLSAELRREWVRSVTRTHVELNQEARLDAAVRLFEQVLQPHPNWELKIDPRGNVDDEEIKVITRRLGCTLRVSGDVYSGIKRPIRDGRGPLALIKDLRNKLAHGTLSFSECGDGVTVSDLKELTRLTVLYLREVVTAFQAYIDAYEFLAPSRRPSSGLLS